MPKKRPNKNSPREEHILAFNPYCQISFGSIHMSNPRVIELARLLGCSVGSVSLKLSNFARLDPALKAHGIRGRMPVMKELSISNRRTAQIHGRT